MSQVKEAPAQDTPKAEATPEAVKSETPATTETPKEPSKEAPKEEPKPAAAKEEAAPESEVAKDAPEEKPVAPEKYDLKLPEDSRLEASALERIAAEAKAQNLTQDQAQALVDRENNAVATYVEQQKQLTAQKNGGEWFETLKNDPEIGGEKLEENGQLVFRAIENTFGSDFAEMLVKANLNQYPPFFKGMVKIAKAFGDDNIVLPRTDTKGQKSIAEHFYGSSN